MYNLISFVNFPTRINNDDDDNDDDDELITPQLLL